MGDLSKYTAIPDLMNAWAHDFQNDIHIFIPDGIVCESEYARPHVLFVMRDMNVQDKHDLCADLRNSSSGWKTWNNAARWLVALLDGDGVYPRNIDRCTQMRKAAVLNIKKEAGGSRAFKKELEEAAKMYGQYIKREIELCDPDILICGGFGNAGILMDYVFQEDAGPWQEITSVNFSRTWWYYFASISGKKVPVISFCHPQVTYFEGKRGHADLFEPLYREMLNFRNIFLMN